MASVYLEDEQLHIDEFGNVTCRNNKLSVTTNKNGYCSVETNIDGKRKRYYVHRLVAKAFLLNPNDYTDVNHVDGNKQNNHVNNLEWCSRSHNLKHAYKLGLKKSVSQILTIEDVRYIKENPKNMSRKELAEKFEVSYWTICNIFQGKSFKGVI